MPLFSIIVPTYNRSALLLEALESVRSQSFEDYEVIVVDDGSADDTAALLAREAGDERWDGRLHVLRQDNAGQGAARNLAIDHAVGEYCTFLDSDDLLFPWSLATLARAIEENERPPLLFGLEHRFHTPEEYADVQPTALQTRRWPDLYTFARTNLLGGPGLYIAKMQAVREAGKFMIDRVVGEDLDLLYRLGTLSPMVQIESPATMGYRMHPEQFTSNTDKWYRGAGWLILRCKSGVYPGGKAREREIRVLICRAAMYFAFMCLFWGGRGYWSALKLYIRTLDWQIRGRQFRYLAKFPISVVLRLVGRWPIRQRDRTRRQLPGRHSARTLSPAS